MTTSKDTIMAKLTDRRKSRHPWIQAAEKVLEVHEGKIVLPVQELDKVDAPAVANLTFQGVDASGQAIASQIPSNFFPDQGDGKQARLTSRKKKGNVDYWWDESMLPMQLGTLARWFVAYGATDLMVRPNTAKSCPQYVPIDPLRCFPSDDSSISTDDAIMVRRESRAWVKRMYPATVGGLWTREPTDSDMVEIIEYVDADEFVILGRLTSVLYTYGARTSEVVELDRFPNLAGRCTLYAAGRPGLAGPKSQFAGVLGLYINRAILAAYNMIGIRKAVIPEKWAMSGDPNITPSIIEYADAIKGDIGIVAGGTITQMLPQPSTLIPMMQDRLERDERVQARIPAEWGGESVSNVRTGRRGDSIYSATVDSPVLEAHMRFQKLLEEANKGAIAIDKAFWGGTSKTFYIQKGNIETEATYDPAQLWDNDRHRVVYSQPGADSAGLAVELGQRLGMEIISHQEAWEMDPFVKDPERTHDLIVSEKMENAILTGLLTRAQSGELPEVDLARMMQRIRDDRIELADAVVQQQAEAQQRQAAQVPAGAPEGQPGLANPGAGAEATVPPPPQALGNVGNLLQRLRLPA